MTQSYRAFKMVASCVVMHWDIAYIPVLFYLIGNYDEFPIKQKHFVQTMRTRTRRDSCFASVLGAGKKDVLLIILNA